MTRIGSGFARQRIVGLHAASCRLGESEEATRAKIDTGENQLAEQRHALDEIDKQIADGRSELQRLQSEVGTHRSRIELNRQRAEEIATMVMRIRSAWIQNQGGIDNWLINRLFGRR